MRNLHKTTCEYHVRPSALYCSYSLRALNGSSQLDRLAPRHVQNPYTRASQRTAEPREAHLTVI